MKRATVALVALMTVFGTSMGISMFLYPASGETGNMEMAIGEVVSEDATFDSLTVTFSQARVYGPDSGWTETAMDDTPVNLTDLEGSGSATIANLSLEAGDYTKVELVVDSVAAQVDGEDVDVFVPSGKLKVVGKFRVFEDGTAGYDFDLRIVKRGNQDVYNLLPVIGKRTNPDNDKGKDKDDDGDDDGGQDSGGNDNPGKGHLMMAIGKSKNDISDFDHLNVTFYKARVFELVDNSTDDNSTDGNSTDGNSTEVIWTEIMLDNVTVDLTNLTATNETIVGNLSLDAGNYTKVELFVSSVVGIVKGQQVEVFVPSGKLKIVGDFEVKANETLELTFDIDVVQRGHRAVYNLLPVIAKNQDDEDDD